jgi:ABC-2 type transport system permease protein
LVVGSLLSLFLAAVGMLVSIFSSSSRYSVSLSFFLLLALYAPHQMPTEATRGWAGETLLRIDPFTGGLPYLERLVLNEHALSQDIRLLVVPLLAAVVLPLLALVAARRLSLLPRERS